MLKNTPGICVIGGGCSGDQNFNADNVLLEKAQSLKNKDHFAWASVNLGLQFFLLIFLLPELCRLHYRRFSGSRMTWVVLAFSIAGTSCLLAQSFWESLWFRFHESNVKPGVGYEVIAWIGAACSLVAMIFVIIYYEDCSCTPGQRRVGLQRYRTVLVPHTENVPQTKMETVTTMKPTIVLEKP